VLGLYLTVTLVAVGTLPTARLGTSSAPLADAALAFGGPLGRRLILACALLTTAATANALLMGTMAALGTVTASAAGGFLYVLHFVPPLVALVALRRRSPGDRPAFATPAPRLVLPLAFAATAALLVASGRTGFALGTAWLLAGLAIRARPRRLP
jgi:APA family basic amino acid/polyamine antiporter